MSKAGKVLTTLGIIGLVAVLITIYVVANSAQNTAQANRDLLSPHLSTHVMAGGAVEFKDLFKQAVGEKENPEQVKDKYVWLTVIVENKGLSEVEDITTVVDLNADVDKIYTTIKPTRYWGGVEVKKKQTGAEFSLGSMDQDESVYMFLGLQPEGFQGEAPFDQKERQLWKRDYKMFFEKVQVNAGDFQKVMY